MISYLYIYISMISIEKYMAKSSLGVSPHQQKTILKSWFLSLLQDSATNMIRKSWLSLGHEIQTIHFAPQISRELFFFRKSPAFDTRQNLTSTDFHIEMAENPSVNQPFTNVIMNCTTKRAPTKK